MPDETSPDTRGAAARGVRCAHGLVPGRAYVVCDKAVADSALTAAVHRAGPNFLGYVVRK